MFKLFERKQSPNSYILRLSKTNKSQSVIFHRQIRIVQPYSFSHQFRLKQIDVGKTLIELFSQKFPFKAIHEWAEKINEGLVSVNNKKVKPDYLLQVNDLISHFNPSIIEPSVPDEIKIIQENKDWIAVFKPAPMPMHAGGRYFKNSLQVILEEQLGYPLFIIHRLDAVTSGIIILGKSEKAADRISKSFRNNEPEKTYRALVKGTPEKDSWQIDKPIRRKDGFVFECCLAETGGKSAQTSFRVLKKEVDYSEIECKPHTGRTHQIRLHLLESGLPIADDKVYLSKNPSAKILQTTAIHLCHKKITILSLEMNIECNLPLWWGDLQMG